MKKGWKIGIISTIVAGAALWIFGKISGVKNMINNLVVTPKWYGGINDMKIDLNRGIKLPLAIDLENNSDVELKVKINYVKATNKDGETFADSATGNYQATLKAKKRVTLPIDIWVSASKLYSIIGASISSIIAGDATIVKNKLMSIVEGANMRINLSSMGVTFDVYVDFGQSTTVEEGKKVSGLGLVSHENRIIRPLSDYQHLLPPYSELEYADSIIINEVTPEETAQFIRSVGYAYKQDTEALARTLERKNTMETVQNIWNFCTSHVKYEEDSVSNEQVRRPLRTLYEQRADCDCYSALIASICENLDLDYVVRIAEYDHKGYFQHVYIIIEGYVCDPVVDKCFYEKPTTKHKNF